MLGSPLADLNVKGAPLPTVYESARRSLAECDRIDECKEWADKAAALASYARQSEDKALCNMAMRIRARAIDRCGELLREIDARGDHWKSRTGTDVSSSRTEEAARAGLSPEQCARATAIASIPREALNTLLAADPPPTIGALVRLARNGRSAKTRRAPTPVENLVDRTAKDLRAFLEAVRVSKIEPAKFIQLPFAMNLMDPEGDLVRFTQACAKAVAQHREKERSDKGEPDDMQEALCVDVHVDVLDELDEHDETHEVVHLRLHIEEKIVPLYLTDAESNRFLQFIRDVQARMYA